MYKKAYDASVKLLFCQSKHIAFLPFSLPSTYTLVFKDCLRAADYKGQWRLTYPMILILVSHCVFH